MTIRIEPDGSVKAMHYDEHSLADTGLGPMRLSRASEIQFDEESQTFYVELPQLKGGVNQPGFLSGFSGYDVARGFEVMLLETCAMSNIKPAYQGEFYALGTAARKRYDAGDTEIVRWEGQRICAR